MKVLRVFFVTFFVASTILFVLQWKYLGAPTKGSKPSVFVVTDTTFDVFGELQKQNFIKSATASQIVYVIFFGDKKIAPGGYRLDINMPAWQILQKMSGKPDLVWVVVREGLRKEQIGELLAAALEWDGSKVQEWNNLYTLDNKPEYAEGVYFPDTYLIPRDETVAEVAQRFINNFNEKFAPYLDKFTAKDIRWVTGLKIASLIQREAGGPGDMKLISGIIWNRLDKGMKLEIDATLQYLHGEVDGVWWGKVNVSDKQSDSPYNLYKTKGLPPTPIANPGLDAIDAALNPEDTQCLYYLHDATKTIHCAKTYQDHLKNIETYLR